MKTRGSVGFRGILWTNVYTGEKACSLQPSMLAHSDEFGIEKNDLDDRIFMFAGTETSLAELAIRVERGEVFALVKTTIFAKASEEQSALAINAFVFLGLPEGVSAKEVRGGFKFIVSNLEFR